MIGFWAQGSDMKEFLRSVPLLERKLQGNGWKSVVHLFYIEIVYYHKMSQHVEIVSNIQPYTFWLNVRTKGPRPSICVRTFTQFTTESVQCSGRFSLLLSSLPILGSPYQAGATLFFTQKARPNPPAYLYRFRSWNSKIYKMLCQRWEELTPFKPDLGPPVAHNHTCSSSTN